MTHEEVVRERLFWICLWTFWAMFGSCNALTKTKATEAIVSAQKTIEAGK